jgi:hypothetical protein
MQTIPFDFSQVDLDHLFEDSSFYNNPYPAFVLRLLSIGIGRYGPGSSPAMTMLISYSAA